MIRLTTLLMVLALLALSTCLPLAAGVSPDRHQSPARRLLQAGNATGSSNATAQAIASAVASGNTQAAAQAIAQVWP